MDRDGLMDGRGVDRMLRDAAEHNRQQQQAQQMLTQVLQQPAVTRRVNVSAIALTDDGDGKLLMVALPSGERWDIPLNAGVVRHIHDATAEPAE